MSATAVSGRVTRRAILWAVTALAVIAAMATILAEASSADPRDPQPIKLVPESTTAPGDVAPLAISVPRRYLCSNHGTLRNAPDAFVMG